MPVAVAVDAERNGKHNPAVNVVGRADNKRVSGVKYLHIEVAFTILPVSFNVNKRVANTASLNVSAKFLRLSENAVAFILLI